MRPFVEWPAEFEARYRAAGYWEGRTSAEAFLAVFEEHASRTAIVLGDRRWTYAELGVLVRGAAARLHEAGLEGERVIFQLPNSLELIVGHLGCLLAGVIPVACQPTHRQAEIRTFAVASGAAAWFAPRSLKRFDCQSMITEVLAEAPSLRHVFVLGGTWTNDPRLHAFDELMNHAPARFASHTRSSDVAVLQLSGGSTGTAKLIPRTHDDYLYVSRVCARATQFDTTTVFLTPLPITHNFSLASPGIQGVLLSGGTVVIAPSPSPDIVLPLIEKERVTSIPSVPATLIGWLDHPQLARFDLKSVHTLYVGGQRLNPEPARRARAVFGGALQQVYGMAEGLICCTRPGDPEEVLLYTQGRPCSEADEIRIVDEAGKPVAPGEVGELETRGPYTTRGYLNATEINRVGFTADGFYRTGDLVRMHPSGNLVVEGRRKDVVNRGGEKIAADELEALILEHPIVSNVAVVPFPDAVLGERICAFVTAREHQPLTLDDITAFLRDVKRVSPTHMPERLIVCDVLPTTAVGKVSKNALKDEAKRIALEENSTAGGDRTRS